MPTIEEKAAMFDEFIMPLIEARDKATGGEWIKDYDKTNGHIKSVNHFKDSTPTILRYDMMREYPDFSFSITNEKQDLNADFIAMSANTMTKIKERMDE